MTISPRQAEVLTLVAQGCTDREIAQRLRVSPRTVRGHLGRVYARLGASSRANAVAIALERQLIFFSSTGE